MVGQIPHETDFPHDGAHTEKLRFVLHYAILAPSSHNTQPWQFSFDADALLMYVDRSRVLPTLDPDGREAIISCGAALFYLRLALHHYGYHGDIQLLPRADDPTLLAEVRLGERYAPPDGEEELFAAITERHTNRQPFEIRPVPYVILALLQSAAKAEGAWVVTTTTLDSRTTLGNVIAEATQQLEKKPDYRRLHQAWVGSDYTLPPLIIDTAVSAPSGMVKSETGYSIASHAPVLAVLGTEGDTPLDWVKAGHALARVLLRTTAHGVGASFLNQPLELTHFREVIDNTWSRVGYAQIVLRLGYGSPAPPTPRNPISEVLC